MKKLLVVLLTTLFVMTLLVSCSSVENCPAYSDASQVELEAEDVA